MKYPTEKRMLWLSQVSCPIGSASNSLPRTASAALKTELPCGGSIETVIPGAGQDSASVAPILDQSSIKLSALLPKLIAIVEFPLG
ncbi:hypothetical protein ACVITL_004793 [Rhizobium pisi]